MNRAMRHAAWLGLLSAFLACSSTDDDDDDLVRQVTRVRVSPQDFLGAVACGLEGGMQRYQATLVDVTDGVGEWFALPSSSVVSCKSQINFEFVQPGHRYIAQITGYRDATVRAQNPGSPVVVDRSGTSVTADWITTCWGDDRGPFPSDGGAGGMGASGDAELGVQAFDRTVVHVRGCEPLATGDTGSVSIDLRSALFGIECGSEAGQVGYYEVIASSSAGGMGGTSGSSTVLTYPCDETAVVEDLPAGQHLDFDLLAYEKDAETWRWESTCSAFTRPDVTVPARCTPLIEP